MPYVNLKMYPGRSEEQKQEAARRIAQVVSEVCSVPEGASFPVVIEEVEKDDWQSVVGGEVEAKAGKLYHR